MAKETDTGYQIYTSEIREIFRYRDFMKTWVVIMMEFEKVEPPWVMPPAGSSECVKSWYACADRRAQNLTAEKNAAASFSSVKDNLGNCVKQNTAANYKEAINYYHQAQPSKFAQKHAVDQL
jgi:hypothetical protein